MAASLPVAHTAANCRWTRLGYRLAGVPESAQPESLLVCTREPGVRRPVTDEECENCELWEPMDKETRWIAE